MNTKGGDCVLKNNCDTIALHNLSLVGYDLSPMKRMKRTLKSQSLKNQFLEFFFIQKWFKVCLLHNHKGRRLCLLLSSSGRSSFPLFWRLTCTRLIFGWHITGAYNFYSKVLWSLLATSYWGDYVNAITGIVIEVEVLDVTFWKAHLYQTNNFGWHIPVDL